MYPQHQHQYPLMDTSIMYNQPLLQHHISYPASQPPPPSALLLPPPEPLPSATDLHTVTLSSSQLADFSATMVHLLWHERKSSTVCHQSSLAPGNGDASSAFKKYCRSILQATQLSESVVLLSLKYIALLLRNNPQLRGAEGSEYRLYTVALMLANKFLDDNTFTNKTWSDISGMKMHELNMMEFEFLDVLQYLLFIQKTDFDQWKTILFNFRNQLHDPSMTDNHQRSLQLQQFIETTLKITTVPMPYHHQQRQDPQWAQHHQVQQQEANMPYHRHHQQQHQVGAAAAAQQQYNQHLYLLSKAQQPHIPPQQLSRPLTRVPLKIPVRPLYQTHGGQTSSSASASHTSTAYDPSIGGTSATVIQPSSASIPQVHQQTQPTHALHQSYDHTRPMVDESLRVDSYPGLSRHQPPTSTQIIAPNVVSQTNFYTMDIYPHQQQHHRQNPLSSAHQQAPLNNNNGFTAFAGATPTSAFYYNTPSATPTSSHSYYHDHSQSSSHLHHHQHHHSTDYINGHGNSIPPLPPQHQVNYGSRPAYYMQPPHQQHIMSTPTSYGEYKNYGTAITPVTNNAYDRPPIRRISSDISYQQQHPVNGHAGLTSSTDYQPLSSNQCQPLSSNQCQPLSISTAVPTSTKQPTPTKPTSGPVPEDPLTAAESYRVPSYD